MDKSGLLDVHHVNFNRFNNSVFNLVPLCKRCHQFTHKAHLNLELKPTSRQYDLLVQLEKNSDLLRGFPI